MSHILTIEVDHLQREAARRLVIEKVKESYSKGTRSVKFITGRKKAGGIGGIIYNAFLSWMSDDKIAHLIRSYHNYDGYYLVTLDLGYLTYKGSKIIYFLMFLFAMCFLYYYFLYLSYLDLLMK